MTAKMQSCPDRVLSPGYTSCTQVRREGDAGMLRKMSHLGPRQAWQTPLLLTCEDRVRVASVQAWGGGMEGEFPRSLVIPPANQAVPRTHISNRHTHPFPDCSGVSDPGYWYLPSSGDSWGLPAWLHGTSPNKQARGC